jgi:hypothetical protein
MEVERSDPRGPNIRTGASERPFVLIDCNCER